MNYIFSIWIILALCFSASGMDVERAEAWVGRKLTPNETATVNYLEPVKVNGVHELCFYAWATVDNVMTNTIVPQSAADQVYGSGVVSNVPLHNFSLKCQIVPAQPTLSVFTMSANYNLAPKKPSRTRFTNADDGVQWLGLSSLYTTNFYNKAEYNILMTDEE